MSGHGGALPNEISGEEFASFMRLRGNGPTVAGVRVRDMVDLSGAVFERDVDLRGIAFLGRVVLAGARFEARLRIMNCTFRGGLDLMAARVAGNLDIGGAATAPTVFRVTNPGDAALDLRHATIGGAFLLEHAEVTGSTAVTPLRADSLTVGGALRFAVLRVKRDWKQKAPGEQPGFLQAHVVVELANASVGGSLHLATEPTSVDVKAQFEARAFEARPSIFEGTVSASGIEVGGDVVLGPRLEIGLLPAWSSGTQRLEAQQRPEGNWTCERDGWIGNLVLADARVRGQLCVDDSARRVTAAGETFEGFLVRIVGAFNLSHGSWGAVNLLHGGNWSVLLVAGMLNADGLATSSIRIEDIRAQGGLSLNGAKIRGDLFVMRSVLGSRPGGAAGLSLRAATVGSVTLSTVVQGPIDAGELGCTGLFIIDSPERRAGRHVAWQANGSTLSPVWRDTLDSRGRLLAKLALRLRRIDIDGHVQLWGATIGSQLRIERTRITGALRLDSSTVQELWLGVEDDGGVVLTELRGASLKVIANLRLGRVSVGRIRAGQGMTCRGQVMLTNCCVGQNLMMGPSARHTTDADGNGAFEYLTWDLSEAPAGVIIEHDLWIEDCEIGGDLVLRRVNVGPRGVDAPGGAIRVSETRIGGKLLAASPEGDAADPTNAESAAHGRDGLKAMTKDPAVAARFRTTASRLDLRNCTVRDVELGGLALSETLHVEECRVTNALDLQRARVGTAPDHGVTLRSVTASTISLADLWTAGPLDASFCTVARNMDLRGTVAAGTGLESGIALRRSSVGGVLDLGARAGHAPASARKLDLSEVKAREVTLTGLHLHPASDDKYDRSGHVDAAGIEVQIFRTCDDPGDAGIEAAHIPGALDLSRSRIDRLVVNAASFDEAEKEADRRGIVLRDAKVDVFVVGRLRPHSPAEARGFPVPLDLSGLTVRDWSFGAEAVGACVYLDILDNDRRINRPLYQTIARQMRERGEDKHALRMHVAEVFRARWEPDAWKRGQGRLRPTRSSLRTWYFTGRHWLPGWSAYRRLWPPLHFPDRWLFRHGMNLMPAFVVILVLAAASFILVANDSRNFEMTPAARQLMASARRTGDAPWKLDRGVDAWDDGQVLGPKPEEWTLWHALWTTVRYHVPIVGLVLRDDFVATDDRRVMLPWSTAWPECGAETLRGAKCSSKWITPEDWFGFMAAINWVLWPLLLTYLVRKIVRS